MKLKKTITWLCILGLVMMLGCASVMDVVTPCYIPPQAIEYAEETEPRVFLPWTTLFDAKRIDAKIDYVHISNQTRDRLEYGYLKEVNAFHIDVASEFQERIFSPEGPIGLLLPGLMCGTLGAVLIPRPGDKKKIVELENTIKNGDKNQK